MHTCKRCNWIWMSRKTPPITCPKCRSPYWDIARKVKAESSLLDIAIKKYGKKKTMEMIKQNVESSSKIED